MKSVVLVIPDGVGIRNFVYGRLISLLQQSGALVTIWHNFTVSEIEILRVQAPPQTQWRKMPPYREGILERILRVAKIYSQLYWFYREDRNWIAIKTRRPGNSLPAKVINLAAKIVGKLLGDRTGTQLIDRWHAACVSSNSDLHMFKEALDEMKTSIVFCSNQRSPLAVPCLAAGRLIKVPTATFIHSWDNLPKGRMAVIADHYFVWSDSMADELGRYYPEVGRSNIKVVGTPQFEPYFDDTLKVDKDRFLASIGAPAGVPLVCYSGCDLYTSPFDQYYLRDIAEVIRRVPNGRRPGLVFRPVPGDDVSRYREVLNAYPEIVLTIPVWIKNEANWENIIPLKEDAVLLVNTIAHCDLVINLGSTVSFDFAVGCKAALYINYNCEEVDRRVWDISDYYEVPHFRIVKAINPVKWINSKKDLEPLIEECLSRPNEKLSETLSWKDILVKHPLNLASDRICSEILVQMT